MMPIIAEMKVFVTSLRNNITWPKLPSDEVPNYTFINNLEEEGFDLVGTVRSNKAGGTTGYVRLLMTAQEFAWIPGTTPLFTLSVHPGPVNYSLPTACTTIQQHTEHSLANEHLLCIFEMEQMIETQMKAHVFSCFVKDIYVGLLTV